MFWGKAFRSVLFLGFAVGWPSFAQKQIVIEQPIFGPVNQNDGIKSAPFTVSSSPDVGVLVSLNSSVSWLSFTTEADCFGARSSSLFVTTPVTLNACVDTAPSSLPLGYNVGMITAEPYSPLRYPPARIAVTVPVQIPIGDIKSSPSEVTLSPDSLTSTVAVSFNSNGSDHTTIAQVTPDPLAPGEGSWLGVVDNCSGVVLTNNTSCSVVLNLNLANVNPAAVVGQVYRIILRVQSSGGTDADIRVYFNYSRALPALPTIESVSNAGSYGPDIAPNTFIVVKGAGLANVSGDQKWGDSPDISSGKLPTTLSGVTVLVNNTPAYIAYLSSKQINALVPMTGITGPVNVQVDNNGARSASFPTQMQVVAPAFFVFSDGKHIATTHPNGSPVAPLNVYPGASPAKPGEVITLWGTGFGRTAPPAPDGVLLRSPYVLENKPRVLFGNLEADVQWAGLVSPGLFQINVAVPYDSPDGDIQVAAVTQEKRSQAGVTVSVKR